MRWSSDTYKKYKEEMEQPKRITKINENEDSAVPELQNKVDNAITETTDEQTEVKE